MEYKCPVPGCEDNEKEFQTEAALKSHIRNKHPGYIPEGEEPRQVPIVEEDFATLLRKFKYKPDLASNIAENISHTGGPNVFEDPAKLLERLSLWSTEISAPKRRNIMDQWFAERNIDIPPEVRKKVEMTSEQMSKNEEKTKSDSNAKYVYDLEQRQVRMAREGEPGGTMEEARELKRMAEADEKEDGQSPFIQDEEGNWRLNPQARISGTELMAYQFMMKSQERGEPLDPVMAMAQAAETFKTIREGLGGGGNNLPAWMTDPATFITTMKELSGGNTGDSALKEQMETMRQTIEEMKEEKWQGMFNAHSQQIKDLTALITKAIDNMSEMEKQRVGRTEMDIIYEISHEGIGVLKTELPGLRKDLKDAFGSVNLPAPKTAKEREDRKGQFKEAISEDRRIEELGQKLFMNES